APAAPRAKRIRALGHRQDEVIGKCRGTQSRLHVNLQNTVGPSAKKDLTQRSTGRRRRAVNVRRCRCRRLGAQERWARDLRPSISWVEEEAWKSSKYQPASPGFR